MSRRQSQRDHWEFQNLLSSVVVRLLKWHIWASFYWPRWGHWRQSKVSCLIWQIPLSLPLVITWMRLLYESLIHTWFWIHFYYKCLPHFHNLQQMRSESRSLWSKGHISSPWMGRMASHVEGWRNAAEILPNCWPCISLGFVSSSGSLKRFLLLWIHYGRRSHLVLFNGKTHRRQNMHKQEGMLCKSLCCLSLSSPFPNV